jgi:glucoamylase
MRILLLLGFSLLTAHASPTLDGWGFRQYNTSLHIVEKAMAQPGAAAGAVVASPSKTDPDYYYHWVRDASLTMDLIAELHAEGATKYDRKLVDYATFSRRLQQTPNPSNGLGEPKFHMDGSAFTGPWGRPQNDGPGIRAFALTRYANTLISNNKDVSFLYKSELPANSVIKADLEYTAKSWSQPSFDIWEEVEGQHFYTRFAQWRALIDGAKLARLLNDNGAADYYEAAAKKMNLDEWWSNGFITTTFGRTGGLEYKASNVDVQVLLASLHFGRAEEGFYSPGSERVLATVIKVVDAFSGLYAINQDKSVGTAIGRYPEDLYNGNGSSKGNPWFLATTAIAEIHYKAIAAFLQKESVKITSTNVEFFRRALRPEDSIEVKAGETITARDRRFQKLMAALLREGDQYLLRVQKHSKPDGDLAEQFNRDNGFQQGAYELTWSHAAFCTSWRARRAVAERNTFLKSHL